MVHFTQHRRFKTTINPPRRYILKRVNLINASCVYIINHFKMNPGIMYIKSLHFMHYIGTGFYNIVNK